MITVAWIALTCLCLGLAAGVWLHPAVIVRPEPRAKWPVPVRTEK